MFIFFQQIIYVAFCRRIKTNYYNLDAMTICETLISDSVPDSIEFRLAPEMFGVINIHCPIVSAELTRFCRLGFIAILK